MAITSAPPPVKRAASTSAPRPTAASSRKKERQEAVNGLGQLAQVPLVAMGQLADAAAIGMRWPAVATELAELADKDERIARACDVLLQVGPYAGLITAVMPLAMQFMVNHGKVQAGSMGTLPPTVLEAQMKTRIMQMEMQAKRAQQQAEKELREMTEAMQKAESNGSGA
jgi:hypothetical protein